MWGGVLPAQRLGDVRALQVGGLFVVRAGIGFGGGDINLGFCPFAPGRRSVGNGVGRGVWWFGSGRYGWQMIGFRGGVGVFRLRGVRGGGGLGGVVGVAGEGGLWGVGCYAACGSGVCVTRHADVVRVRLFSCARRGLCFEGFLRYFCVFVT